MVRVFPRNTNLLGAADHGWPWNGSQGSVIAADLKSHHLVASLPVVCRQSHRRHAFDVFYRDNSLGYDFSQLLLDTIIIIFFTKFVRFLLRPLRQPRIVSEIIGGMILGPSILGHSRRFNYYLFPDTAEYLVKNFGVIGFMYFLFITGVKTDIFAVVKSKKKHICIAAASVVVPFVLGITIGFSMRQRMEPGLAKVSSIGGVASSLAFTSFPVIYTVLKELNLLNSEVGQFALSVALLGDAVGINSVLVFEAMMQGEAGAMAVVCYLISIVVFGTFLLTVVKRALQWVIKKTPEGQPVDQNYIVLILLGVMVMGFITDMLGMAIANGPFFLGLLIPDGPPLGTTLVERSEMIISEILMPFSFALVGIYTNVYSINEEMWSRSLSALFTMSLVANVSKFIATTTTALLLKTPVRDSLTLAFIMNLRGQIETLMYVHWMDKRIIGMPGFTLLTLHAVTITAISTPFISILYDPTRPYMTNKRRTIQHTPPCTELGLVLAVSGEDAVAGLISLLELSYPTISSPFSIFALRLVELVGRATPMFIDHKSQDKEEEDICSRYIGPEDIIHNALSQYQETRQECVKLHAYTALTPWQTMYQDICKVALLKQTAFILLPYCKERADHSTSAVTDFGNSGMRSVNSDVLSHAPCSVGIYYEKGRQTNPLLMSPSRNGDYRLVVLFLGGADNREALHLADRMTANPNVTLTVIRFLSHNQEGDNAGERKLDDGVVTWFWVNNEANKRVLYKEVVVRNGAETLAAIQAMNVNNYDLWMTGRREGINPKLLEGLTTWSEDDELGVVGDCVAASDFPSEGSVLVVQQQIMRGQKNRIDFLHRKLDSKNLRSLWTN